MKQTLPTRLIPETAGFERLAFRNALGQFPTGVAVITTRTASGLDLGMTISSFNSVSLSPPLILFSIDRQAHTFHEWMAAETIGINILSEHQASLSTQFSKPLENKWVNVEFSRGLNNIPLLSETVASFESVPVAHYEGGDHIIFVCEVVNFNTDSTFLPLIFHRGKYASLRCKG